MCTAYRRVQSDLSTNSERPKNQRGRYRRNYACQKAGHSEEDIEFSISGMFALHGDPLSLARPFKLFAHNSAKRGRHWFAIPVCWEFRPEPTLRHAPECNSSQRCDSAYDADS